MTIELKLTKTLRFAAIITKRGFFGGFERMVEIDHRGRETWASI